MNPFLTKITNLDGEPVAALDAAERIRMVERFSVVECYQALAVPNLQITVKGAIKRRLRQLAKADAHR